MFNVIIFLLLFLEGEPIAEIVQSWYGPFRLLRNSTV